MTENLSQTRCVNIDWLQLYCTQQYALELPTHLRSFGFFVDDEESRSRHFAREATVKTRTNEKYMSIQYMPLSLKSAGGIWEKDACMVKLYNKFCYEPDAVQKLCDTLMRLNIKMRSISRFDVALDLQYFDNNLKPQTLIENFFKNRYTKVGVTKFCMFGNQTQTQSCQYLRFGSGASACSVYLYNKSQEMRDKQEKPYIRDAWEQCGLNNGKDVWRLEFSLRSDAKHMIQTNDTIVKSGKQYYNSTTGEVLPEGSIVKYDRNNVLRSIIKININEIDTQERLLSLYSRLYAHYFRFRYTHTAKKKADMKPVELLKISEEDKAYKPISLTATRDVTRTDKLVMRYILSIANTNKEATKSVFDVVTLILQQQRHKLANVNSDVGYITVLNEDIKTQVNDYATLSSAMKRMHRQFASAQC
jgi:hypothetical protein